MPREAWLIRPEALVPYAEANRWMHDLAERRLRDEIPDTLILLEHPPVFTAGRRSNPSHVRWTRERILAAGAEYFEADRGGSLTFHGPGQLVGYPILDLGRRPDVVEHLRRLEEVVIRASADLDVELGRDPVQTGVWAGDKKVCAIGVKLMRWRVTIHGFGLNCSTDLSWFDAIVPCGLAGRGVTSLSEFAGREMGVRDMIPLVADRFEAVFDARFDELPGSLEPGGWTRTVEAPARA